MTATDINGNSGAIPAEALARAIQHSCEKEERKAPLPKGGLLELSPRLERVAAAVPAGSVPIDVGTDHAYVPVYLVLSGICKKAFAGDVRPGPLQNAEKTVMSHGVGNKVFLFLSDGLLSFPPRCGDTVIIAGMGGDSIAKIVSDCEWIHSEGISLVLQPMTMHEKCRRLLAGDGFRCVKESYVCEGNRVYCVMSYTYDRPHVVDELTAYTGMACEIALSDSPESPAAKKYLETRLSKLRKALCGLENSSREECMRQAWECRRLIELIDKSMSREKR